MVAPNVKSTRSKRANPAVTSHLDDLVATKEVLIACGPGGVGKTTTAAATGLIAALRYPKNVLVLTIDPAKRLANALGLEGIGNDEREIPDGAFNDLGLTPKGQLSVAMLDTKQSWDALIRRHAPDVATANAILVNPLYHNITSRFVQSHEYIAMERLYDLHSSGKYDLIVVDTPPTRNALDFLDAPERMADFFASRLLRWLITPYRSRIVNIATKPFYQIADRILGSQFLQDIAEFFVAFQSMYDGFVKRAQGVDLLLSDDRTGFMVVSTLEPVPAREAKFFVDELNRRKLNLEVMALNKVLPSSFRSKDAAAVAEKMREDSDKIADKLAGKIFGEDVNLVSVSRVLKEVGTSFQNFQNVALQEASLEKTFAKTTGYVASVPFYDSEISDLASLADLGSRLWK